MGSNLDTTNRYDTRFENKFETTYENSFEHNFERSLENSFEQELDPESQILLDNEDLPELDLSSESSGDSQSSNKIRLLSRKTKLIDQPSNKILQYAANLPISRRTSSDVDGHLNESSTNLKSRIPENLIEEDENVAESSEEDEHIEKLPLDGNDGKKVEDKSESSKVRSHEIESHEIESHDIESHEIESHGIESHEIDSHESNSLNESHEIVSIPESINHSIHVPTIVQSNNHHTSESDEWPEFEVKQKLASQKNMAKTGKSGIGPKRQVVKSHAGVLTRYRYRSINSKASENSEDASVDCNNNSAPNLPISLEKFDGDGFEAEDDNATNASHTSACFDSSEDEKR